MSAHLDPIIPNPVLRRGLIVAVGVALVILVFADIQFRSRPHEEWGGRRLGDWQVCWNGARLLFNGGDPYDFVDSRGFRYVYPLFFAVTIAPLTRLSMEDSMTVWALLSIAMLWGIYVESRRLLLFAAGSMPSTPISLPSWLAAAVIVASAFPVVACLQAGQTSIAMLWLCLSGFRLVLTSGRPIAWWGAGVVLMAAVAIKLSPALAPILLALQMVSAPNGGPVTAPRKRAATLVGGLVAGALLWLFLWPASFLGWNANWNLLAAYVQRIVSNRLEVDYDSNVNQALHASLMHVNTLSGSPLSETAARVVAATLLGLFVVVVVGIVTLLARRGSVTDHLLAYAFALGAIVVCAPTAWYHALLFATPLSVTAPLWLLGRERQVAAMGSASAFTLLIIVSFTYRSTLGATIPVLGLGFALWMFVMAMLVVTTLRRPIRNVPE